MNYRIIKQYVHQTLNIITSYIAPIILIPFIVSRIGISNYGTHVFSIAIINYISIIVSLGFDISLQSKISQEINKNKLSEIISDSLYARLIIALIFIATTGGLWAANIIKKEIIESILYGAGIIIGNALVPNYLYQGISRFDLLFFINSINKIISMFIILLTLSSEEYIYLNAMYSTGSLAGAITSVFFIWKKLNLTIKKPSMNRCLIMIKENLSSFFSVLGSSLYRESAVIAIGYTCETDEVGKYAVIEKIIKAIQAFSNTIVTVLIPNITSALAKNNTEWQSIYNSKLKLIKLYFWTIWLILVAATIIITSFLPHEYKQLTPMLISLSLIIPIGGESFYIAYSSLLGRGMQKEYMYSVLLAGIVGISVTLILSSNFGIYGASVGCIASEILLLLKLRKYSKSYTKIDSRYLQ